MPVPFDLDRRTLGGEIHQTRGCIMRMNRAQRTGYEVVRVPIVKGRANGEFQDFLTGFVTPDGKVWGRPVAIAFATDGSMLVTDDGSNSIWRWSYPGK